MNKGQPSLVWMQIMPTAQKALSLDPSEHEQRKWLPWYTSSSFVSRLNIYYTAGTYNDNDPVRINKSKVQDNECHVLCTMYVCETNGAWILDSPVGRCTHTLRSRNIVWGRGSPLSSPLECVEILMLTRRLLFWIPKYWRKWHRAEATCIRGAAGHVALGTTFLGPLSQYNILW